MMQPGAWTKDGKRITGRWEYYWPGETFNISLDEKDPITGKWIYVHTNGGLDFNGWKFERQP